MFPVNDFNFVVAGLATFAATVGYACTQKLSASFSGPGSSHEANLEQRLSTEASTSSSNMDDTTTMTSEDQDTAASNQESLKRKVPDDGFDETNEKLGYPDSLANIYPSKRSRTPSSESNNSRTRAPVVAADSSSSITPGTSKASDEDIEIPFVSQETQPIVTTPASEPPRTPSPVSDQLSPPAVSPPPTPAPVVIDRPRPIAALPKRPSTPKAITSSSGGFAAFAGSASPFKSQQPTPTFNSSRPIWTTPTTELTVDHELETSKSNSIEAFMPTKGVGLSEAKLAKPKYTHITGEEEEDVELEIKGVRLFVKRGTKPFLEGILGHVKLLSNRTTLDERILFRREPLWQVSMNVRVHPTVRCSFAPEENVLRIMLKEAVGGTGNAGSSGVGAQAEAVQKENPNQEVVVYALTPGRSCSKRDFKEFAESLIQSSHFKSPSTSTPSVTATAADAVASPPVIDTPAVTSPPVIATDAAAVASPPVTATDAAAIASPSVTAADPAVVDSSS